MSNIYTNKSIDDRLRSERNFKLTTIFLSISIVFLAVGASGIFIALNIIQRPFQEIFCVSDVCLREAAYLKSLIDEKIDPCDDFYSFVCRKWGDKHLKHTWDERYDGVEKIKETFLLKLRKFLETKISNDDPHPLRQSKKFFVSCLKKKQWIRKNYLKLFEYMEKANLPDIPIFLLTNSTKSTFDFARVTVGMKRILGIDLFFDVSIIQDIYNTSRNIIYLSPSRYEPLILQVSNFNNLKDKKMVKRLIKDVIKKVFSYRDDVKLNETIVNSACDVIWEIHNVLLKTADNVLDSYGDESEFRNVTVDGLQKITNSFVPIKSKYKNFWRNTFRLLFEDIENDDTNNKDIYYLSGDIEHIHRILLSVAGFNDNEIELYSWFIGIFTLLSTVDDGYLSEIIPEKYQTNQNINCVDLTVQYMSHAIGSSYVNQTSFNIAKLDIISMIANIKKSFIDRIENELNWIDNKTKTEFVIKMKRMNYSIGLEEWSFNKTIVEDLYSKINVDVDDFLDNVMSILKNSVEQELVSLSKQATYMWGIFSEVDAYYYAVKNSLLIPMALFSFPFYRPGIETLNYGAIGSVLGHKMIHGFDTDGILFDADGTLRDFRRKKFLRRFERKLSCYEEQYKNFSYPGMKITDQNENLADNSGLRLAYYAYRKFLGEGKLPKTLPGFEGFTNEQLFFIGYATSTCENPPPPNAARVPNHVRVLGTLQNSHEFSRAFSCKLGTRMNPKRTRCEIL